MKKKIIILGSTGSIGETTLSILNYEKDFKIELLSTNRNANKLLSQAKKFNVKNVIISDKNIFFKYKNKFKKNNINLYHGFKNLKKIVKKRVNYCINSITGIEGLDPTLKIIPLTRNILIANKESIICGWHIIKKKLKKYNTNFIPIDSEHFSIWQLIKNDNFDLIDKVILTASGGPFYGKSFKKIYNMPPYKALNHPKWKMGKKISIDSSTMMNKIFEFIEAKKLFNLKNNNIQILIHPKSFVHAVIFFKNDLIKFLAHETDMKIPIKCAMNIYNKKITKNIVSKNLKNFNSLSFNRPMKKNFPLLEILDLIPEKTSYFETILITINDTLVDKYLKYEINYKSLQFNLLNLLKKPYFTKYYKLKPNDIYDIIKMTKFTKSYLKKNLKKYD